MSQIRPLSLRLARWSEAAAIARMSRDLIERGLRWSWRTERVARHIARADTLCVVAHDASGHLAGFAMMQYLETSAHLLLFAVAPGWRRSGLGRELVAWLESCAQVAGTFEIHLEVRASNTGGRAFYMAMGYQEVALVPGYYQGRESAVRMIRNVSVLPESLLPP